MLLIAVGEGTEFQSMPEELDGYWWETEQAIVIPFVVSQNASIFLRWLHSLEATGKIVFFPTIINGRLAMLLRKRGYQVAFGEMSPEEQQVWGEQYREGLAKLPLQRQPKEAQP